MPSSPKKQLSTSKWTYEIASKRHKIFSETNKWDIEIRKDEVRKEEASKKVDRQSWRKKKL